MSVPRVVSTLPSATEILYALDLPPVGVSHACSYPREAREVPTVTEADPEGGFRLQIEIIEELDPDIVVTQDLCEMCAIDTLTVETQLQQQGITATILKSHPHRVADVLDEISRIGDAIGKQDAARSLVNKTRQQLETITAQATPDNRPDVVVCDWMDPIMIAGHWVPELVDTAGGNYPLESPGSTATPREWEQLRDLDPDILVVAPCDYSVEQTLDKLSALRERPGWDELSAVRTGRVYVVDGVRYMNCPSHKIGDTAAILQAIISGRNLTEFSPLTVRQLSPDQLEA